VSSVLFSLGRLIYRRGHNLHIDETDGKKPNLVIRDIDNMTAEKLVMARAVLCGRLTAGIRTSEAPQSSRLALLGLPIQPNPDPAAWVGEDADALAFGRLLDFHDRRKTDWNYGLGN